MLRHLKDQLNGRKAAERLPATSYSTSSSPAGPRWNPLANNNIQSPQMIGNTNNGSNGSYRDGSAAAIDTVPQLQKIWQRASVPTRTSYITLVTAVCMVWYGWRWVRYDSAGILLDCHSVLCELKVTPIGWGKSVVIRDMPRHQLVDVFALKTTRDGTFVTDQDIVLHEPYTHSDSNNIIKKNNKKGGKKKGSSYKGPDENGHYLSYGIVFADAQPPNVAANHRNMEDGSSVSEEGHNTDNTNNENGNRLAPDADLHLLRPYMDWQESRLSSDTDKVESSDGAASPQQQQKLYRLTPRKFGVRASKRRVRTMIQKLDSYIKKRRQKLVLREFAPPAWQGVILMVVGCMSFFLVLALGQFSDPVVHRGPGVRRQQQQQGRQQQQQQHQYPHRSATKSKRDSVTEAYQSATPSQYEVSTSSTPPSSGGAMSYRRNTAQTTRKRPS